MIKALVSDLSRTLLFPIDSNYTGGLNDLYSSVKDQPGFDFWKYFKLNQDLLDKYKRLKEDLSIYIFTSGFIQEDPSIMPLLEEVFEAVLNLETLGATVKNDSSTFFLLAERIGQEPRETIFVDDMDDVLEAAQGAEFKTVKFSFEEDFYMRLNMVLENVQQ